MHPWDAIMCETCFGELTCASKWDVCTYTERLIQAWVGQLPPSGEPIKAKRKEADEEGHRSLVVPSSWFSLFTATPGLTDWKGGTRTPLIPERERKKPWQPTECVCVCVYTKAAGMLTHLLTTPHENKSTWQHQNRGTSREGQVDGHSKQMFERRKNSENSSVKLYYLKCSINTVVNT